MRVDRRATVVEKARLRRRGKAIGPCTFAKNGRRDTGYVWVEKCWHVHPLGVATHCGAWQTEEDSAPSSVVAVVLETSSYFRPETSYLMTEMNASFVDFGTEGIVAPERLEMQAGEPTGSAGCVVLWLIIKVGG